MIDGHAHACGVCFDSLGVLQYLEENNLEKIILSAGEQDKRGYNFPNLGSIFKSSSILYVTNRIIALVTRIKHGVELIHQGNEKVAKMAEEYPDRILNTYWINPTEADCIQKMEDFCKRHSFAMLKLHQCWTRFSLRDSSCSEVISWANEHNKPIFIHIRSKKEVKEFIRVVEANPGVIFINAHLIGIEEFKEDIPKNIYLDISCAPLHSIKMMKKAYRTFGAGRILLGSDIPYGQNNIRLALQQMQTVGMSQEEIERVCYWNFQEFL